MKYLVVGLGNIGYEYLNTRHNIGFQVVDSLAEKFNVEWESKSKGLVAKIRHKGRILVLLKPTTYMNLSGKSVAYWMQQEKINIENLIVVLDDLNLPFGSIRLKPKGSDGGHNGLKNIQLMIGTSIYPRLRIGIGNQFLPGHQANFVLGKWQGTEIQHLSNIIEDSINCILDFTTIGIGPAMTTYNQQNKL